MLELRIVSMAWEVFAGAVEYISLPTQQWIITILPWHINLVTTLQEGTLSYVPLRTDRSALQEMTDKKTTVPIKGWLAMIESDVVTIAAE